MSILTSYPEIPSFLGRTQNFTPQDEVKYEFHDASEDRVQLLLAAWIDHTNVLILYDPAPPTPHHATGTLTPDATGNYPAEGEWNDQPSYVGPDREFFIWWDGIDSWLINDYIGRTDGIGWKRTDPAIDGEYAPYGGAVGTATVEAGEE